MSSSHAVVVLNYKGRQDTLACITSLMQAAEGVVVYLVDNASRDGVIEDAIDAWGPSVRGIQLASNMGFSGGMNAGILAALASGHDVVTVLNNDTVVPAGVMPRLEEYARRGIAVSPLVMYADEPQRLWFAGGTVDSSKGIPRHLSPAEVNISGSPVLRETMILAGCCVSANAETWQKVGVFDDRYFLMFEDSDWSMRAVAEGIPLVVALDVRIYHKVSASFGKALSFVKLYYYTRNGFLFAREWADEPLRFSACFLRRQLVPRVVSSARRGEFRQALREGAVVIAAAAAFLSGKYGRMNGGLEGRLKSWADH